MTSRRSRERLLHERYAARTGGGRAAEAGGRSLEPRSASARPYALVAGAALAAAAGLALVNRAVARRAERENPPEGRFVEVRRVRLHYVESGSGEPLVLLHGNGSMVQDFETSGLIGEASRSYRVVAFDRPGYGYSERPDGTVWTPDAQADLIRDALSRLGISRALVLGHSWGALVAAALARKHPDLVAGLVLVSGYYYPSARADVLLLSGPALPVIGPVLRYTVAPPLGWAIWPLLMRRIFGPAAMPDRFREGFPKALALRPSQLRASAEESALMIPGALAGRRDYARMAMPVAVVAGEEDRLIDIEDQSARLHAEVRQSTLRRVPGAGHMVHQTAPGAVMAAIDEVAAASRRAETRPGAP